MNINVSSGIPRLRELIDATPHTKTPCLNLELQPPVCFDRVYVQEYASTLNETYLKDVLQSCQVEFTPRRFDPLQPHETDVLMLQSYRAWWRQVEGEEEALGARESRYVLRLVLHTERLASLHMTLGTVVQAIEREFPNHRECFQLLVAEPHMPEAVIRLRPLGLAAAAQADSEVARTEPLEYERNMAQLLLKEMCACVFLTGLKGVHHASVLEREEHALEAGQQPRLLTRKKFGIQLAGSDLRRLWELELCDWKRTWANDVLHVAEVLGIEAAAQLLFHEIKQVLAFDGGTVDDRHVMVIVNSMTRTGGVAPLSRHGFARMQIGPLQQASFEETVPVLFEAAQFGKTDHITGISDNVIFGQHIRGGTGCVTLLQPHSEKKPQARVVRTCFWTYAAEKASSGEPSPTSPVLVASSSPRWTSPTSPVLSATSPVLACSAFPEPSSPPPLLLPEPCGGGHPKATSYAVESGANRFADETQDNSWRPASPVLPALSSGYRPPSPTTGLTNARGTDVVTAPQNRGLYHINTGELDRAALLKLVHELF